MRGCIGHADHAAHNPPSARIRGSIAARATGRYLSDGTTWLWSTVDHANRPPRSPNGGFGPGWGWIVAGDGRLGRSSPTRSVQGAGPIRQGGGGGRPRESYT